MTIIYLPSLTELLFQAERQKGRLLTRQEVEAIRDGAIRVSIPEPIARYLEPACGGADIDPLLCWESWSRLRSAELGHTGG
ncbi:hypothetical protein AAH446_03630 [Erwinia sp. P6884]|uniref:hypothetical protein n=1 Tax=Erwinia sp. P6884 TaxID=3141450 RepID=UPI00318B8849